MLSKTVRKRPENGPKTARNSLENGSVKSEKDFWGLKTCIFGAESYKKTFFYDFFCVYQKKAVLLQSNSVFGA